MKRKFEIELHATVEIEIDDEATSDWDGLTILQRVDAPDAQVDGKRIWSDGATREDLLAILGHEVGINNRDCSRIDGFADFSDDAVRRLGWPDWHTERVQEI